MSDYKEQVNSLQEHADLIETSIELYGPSATRLLVYDLRNAAAAIEDLQANVKDLNEALKVESKARENAESKRYCYNCAHMDASMYDEAWYGICKLNDFEVEAIHGWGCTDWAKMEVQDG